MDAKLQLLVATAFALLLLVVTSAAERHRSGNGHGQLWQFPAAVKAVTDDVYHSRTAAAGHQQFVLDARNIIALCVAFLVASLAASAGVGGGAFFVPLAMVCLNFSLKEATVLSQASIAAVSLASIAFNLRRRHPVHPATKTLIDYDMCLTMTPALLVGVSLGVIFNAAFPTWLITTLLISMLAFMSVKTTQKGLSLWRAESATLRHQQQQGPTDATAESAEQPGGPTAAADPAVLPVSTNTATAPASPAAVVVITDNASETPGSNSSSSSKPIRAPYPWHMAVGVLCLWAGFAGSQLLKQRTQRCSPAYFAVAAAQVLFGAGSSLLFAYYCIARPARQAAAATGDLTTPLLANRPQSVGQLLAQRQQHQKQNMAQLATSAAKVAIAGVVAGVLGIGGGMLMAPMLLASGVHPQAASATSNILVFLTSSSATLAFVLDGRVDLQYSAVYCAVCGSASLIGLTLFGRLVKASGRPSIVVLLLAFIMGAGAACSGVFGYIDAWHQAQQGAAGWKSIC